MKMKIEAAQRLKAAKHDPVLDSLCEHLCDQEEDQVCDNDAGNEIEYYGSMKDAGTALKGLGYKGKGDEWSNGHVNLKLTSPKGGRNFSGKTTYIRVAA
jgi:hypothetical protein